MIEKELQWPIRLLVILLFSMVISCTKDADPDLWVYLSMEQQPGNLIDLESLHSRTVDQPYSIPANVKAYPFALIHCKAYNRLFGSPVLH